MVKIGFDKNAEMSYYNLTSSKQIAFTELVNHVKQFIKIDKIDFEAKDLSTEIVLKVLNSYKGQFPKIVKDEKILELIGLEKHKLKSLVDRFNSLEVEFDVKTEESPEVDFSIYAKNTRQAEEFFNISSLVDEANKHLDKVSVGLIPRQQICNLFGGILMYDSTEHKFKPNIRYILSLK